MIFEHEHEEMRLRRGVAALVITDLHNDFLTPGGRAFALIEESLERNGTATNIERLLLAAKSGAMKVFISPHYCYPHDHAWVSPLTPVEDLAHQIGLLDRPGPLNTDGLEGSGADFPDRYKPYLDGNTIVTSPHKVYGASSNDMILQLRRHRIEQVIMAGPVGNLCVEGHMRDFIENGFEVAMVRDATAGARNQEGDGYEAALINWRFLAHALWTTNEAVHRINALAIVSAWEAGQRGKPETKKITHERKIEHE